MTAIRRSILGTFLLTAGLVLGGCSSGGGGSASSGPGTTSPPDDTPVSAKSAAGLWRLHYEWDGKPTEAWTTFFGSNTSGDLVVAIPSEQQSRGMFAAETEWGFAPMTAKADGGKVKWTFSLSGADGPFTLDFEGSGTGASLEGSATFSNGGPSATWSATKERSAILPLKNLAGDWTLDFQWSRRTPGQLLVTCDDRGTCKIPGGQSGGPSKDEIGLATLDGNELAIKFPGATHVGVITSESIVWGYMDSTDGNTGVWSAKRGNAIGAEPTDEGCTADVDCGSCERCERSTGRCISRLTC